MQLIKIIKMPLSQNIRRQTTHGERQTAAALAPAAGAAAAASGTAHGLMEWHVEGRVGMGHGTALPAELL